MRERRKFIRSRKACYSLLAVLISTASNAQSAQLRGRVVDNDLVPVFGAGITLAPAGKTAVTDADGYFSFSGVWPGVQWITVSSLGYQPHISKISLREHVIQIPDIVLHRSVTELGEVVVAESYSSRLQKKEPLTMEVVSATFIKRHLGGSLMQSLQRLPGIKTISIGSGSAKPLIRGLGFNQVVVIENGIKHEGQQWGADHGLEIDQYSVSSVEIIKGPSSFMYGSDAIGGAVNILPPVIPPANTWGGSLDLTAKSNNHLAGTSVRLYGRRQRWFADSRLTLLDYADYRVPADTVHVYNYAVGLHKNHVRNTAGRELNLHLSTGYVSEHLQSIVDFSRIYTKSGFFANAHGLEPRRVDTGLHDKSGRDILHPYQEVTHTKISNRTHYQSGSHQLELQAGYQKNFRREWSRYVNHGYMPPIYPMEREIPADLEREYDKDVWSFNFKDEITAGVHQLSAGLNSEVQDNTIGGWGFLIPSFRQFSAGVFMYDKIKWSDRLLLHLALRADHGRIHIKEYVDWFPSEITENHTTVSQYLQRAQNITRNFNSLTWSAGVNFNPEGWVLKANAGTGFRMPIAKELAANGVNYHYFRYEKGDADLPAERSYQLDVGITREEADWSVQVTPFLNYFPHFIFLTPTFRHDYYYGGGNQIFEYTHAKVLRYGGELQAKYRLHPHWSTEVLAEYVYSRQTSGSKKGYTLPFAPPASGIFSISYEPVFKKVARDTYFSLDTRLTARQNNIVPPEKKTPGYCVLNLSAGTGFNYGKQTIYLYLQVQNLLNRRYLNHTSFYRLIELPEAGRNVVVSLRIPVALSNKSE